MLTVDVTRGPPKSIEAMFREIQSGMSSMWKDIDDLKRGNSTQQSSSSSPFLEPCATSVEHGSDKRQMG